MFDPLAGTFISFFLLLVFLAVGFPICISLGLSGLIGLLLTEGFSGTLFGFTNIIYHQLFSFGLLAVPVFVLMGNLLFYHGIGKDLYETMYKWLGKVPGGLLVSSTVMCALFGFMCGSNTAAVATIGSVSIPELEKRKYDLRMSLGTMSVAGSLAVLIPPSTLMILYAVISEASMGRLFFAGIIPGILLSVLISAFIVVRCIINPELSGKSAEFPISEKLKSLVNLIPVMVLFVTVLGGIFVGVWSPTEAGAGGTLIAFIICWAYKRVTWKKVKLAVLDTVKICCMIYQIVIGALIFSYLTFLSGFNELVSGFMLSMNVAPWTLVIIMLMIMMIMGMFLDVIALIYLTIPVFLPIIVDIGYHPVWWGIMMIVATEMALITPPVGVNLYIIKGVAPERLGVTVYDVAMGSAPFVIILWVMFLLMTFFPEIVMWLPNLMKG